MHIYVGAMESRANNLRINKSGEVTFNAGLSCFKGLVHPKLWRLHVDGGTGDFCLEPRQMELYWRVLNMCLHIVWCHPSVPKTQLSNLSRNDDANTVFGLNIHCSHTP